jgi:prepilin-type N-terminal cleavage/methylation domain-containing protein
MYPRRYVAARAFLSKSERGWAVVKKESTKKGFTLVEVIVVAVIVMILAAVAIPMYVGYVNDSRKAAAENIAGSVAAAVGSLTSQGITTASIPLKGGPASATWTVPAGYLGAGSAVSIIIPNNFTVSATAGVVRVSYAGGSVTAGY